MRHQTINYTEDGRVNLVTYFHEYDPTSDSPFLSKKKPVIIVLPGGAYGMLSAKEAEPVALTFLKEGFHTAVLNYSIGDYSEYPNPLIEVSWAIKLLREKADQWGIQEDGIALMGFSAGAGIASLSATQWNNPEISNKLNAINEKIRPNAVVLGYGAARNSTIMDDPEQYKPDFLGKISTDRTPELDFPDYVGPHMPPVFIWGTRFDKYVPAKNQTMMMEAMEKFNLPYEVHYFQSGQHGMSVCNELSSLDQPEWQNESVAM